MFAKRMPGKLRKAPSTAEATARNSLNTHRGVGPLGKKNDLIVERLSKEHSFLVFFSGYQLLSFNCLWLAKDSSIIRLTLNTSYTLWLQQLIVLKVVDFARLQAAVREMRTSPEKRQKESSCVLLTVQTNHSSLRVLLRSLSLNYD